MKEKKVKGSLSKRITQVATLCTKGYSVNEIADITGLRSTSVVTYISLARSNGLLSHDFVINKKPIVKMKRISNSTNVNLIRSFMHNHPDIFDEKQLPENIDIEQIANIVMVLGYPKSDVNILVRLYSNNKLYEEAVNVLYLYQQSNDLTIEEIKNVEILRHQLRIKEAKYFFGKVPNTLIDPDSNSFDER